MHTPIEKWQPMPIPEDLDYWIPVRSKTSETNETNMGYKGESVMDCGYFYVDAFGRPHYIPPPNSPEPQDDCEPKEEKKYSITIDIDETKMETNFRKFNEIELYDVGTRVSRNERKGVIKAVIIPRCYSVLWDDGEEEHMYHHEFIVASDDYPTIP